MQNRCSCHSWSAPPRSSCAPTAWQSQHRTVQLPNPAAAGRECLRWTRGEECLGKPEGGVTETSPAGVAEPPWRSARPVPDLDDEDHERMAHIVLETHPKGGFRLGPDQAWSKASSTPHGRARCAASGCRGESRRYPLCQPVGRSPSPWAGWIPLDWAGPGRRGRGGGHGGPGRLRRRHEAVRHHDADRRAVPLVADGSSSSSSAPRAAARPPAGLVAGLEEVTERSHRDPGGQRRGPKDRDVAMVFELRRSTRT